jgi:hypothetical protein
LFVADVHGGDAAGRDLIALGHQRELVGGIIGGDIAQGVEDLLGGEQQHRHKLLQAEALGGALVGRFPPVLGEMARGWLIQVTAVGLAAGGDALFDHFLRQRGVGRQLAPQPVGHRLDDAVFMRLERLVPTGHSWSPYV